MKKEEILIIGAVGVGAYLLFKSKGIIKGAGDAVGGVGDAVGGVGGFIGDVGGNIGTFFNKLTNLSNEREKRFESKLADIRQDLKDYGTENAYIGLPDKEVIKDNSDYEKAIALPVAKEIIAKNRPKIEQKTRAKIEQKDFIKIASSSSSSNNRTSEQKKAVSAFQKKLAESKAHIASGGSRYSW